MNQKKELVLFQTEDGALELKADASEETIWANLNQIAVLFGRDKSVISRHIKNVLKSGELEEKVVVAKNATTTQHGAIKGKTQTKGVNFYNLDLIISVGYRVNSKTATKFRIWATKTLKQHITQGYTINQSQLEQNKQQFMQAIEDLKVLAQDSSALETEGVLSLIQSFSSTFFALDSYDKNEFPQQGGQTEIEASATELETDLQKLKADLIKKGEASHLFAQEKRAGSLEGIFGTVFQSVFGKDAYPSTEEKAAHLCFY